MSVEIEKKYLVDKSLLNFLKNNHQHEVVGIAQWYIDNAEDKFSSKRIRLIISSNGYEKWILGTKKCLNNSLIFREEIEKEIKFENENIILKNFPFILKMRYLFKEYSGAELVVDEFPENPFISYDLKYLMEIEIDESFSDYQKTFNDVYDYYKIKDAEDISENFKFTNHAIAKRSFNKTKKPCETEEIKLFLKNYLKVK
jgi:CYTH domain-containing protein